MPTRFHTVVDAYLNSPKFLALRPRSQQMWKAELLFACKFIGHFPTDEIRPSIIQEFLDGLSEKPGKQAVALTALRAVQKWAIVRDLLCRSITEGVETGKPQGGHAPWTEEQVVLAETKARLDLARIVTLGANTGQRGSDLVRMGWSDIETFQGRDGINVKQVKTGKEIWVPILEPLRKAMEAWERQPGPFCRQRNGALWTRPRLSDEWYIERDANPALSELSQAGLVLHGLRSHACVRLYRAGCTTRQVADMVGMSEPMVERYCRLSSNRENNLATVIQLENIREQKRDVSGSGSKNSA
jgi:integrase